MPERRQFSGDRGFSDGQYWEQEQFLDEQGIVLPPEPVYYPHPRTLHEAIAPYVDVAALRRLAAAGEDIRKSFRLYGGQLPEELAVVFEAVKLLLRPPDNHQIKSPHDIAAFLMLDMGFLEQEQFKVVCLDTRNQLQKIHLVYQGSLNTSLIRVGEVFKAPIWYSSASVIVAHNHPSSDPSPSPEDVLVTRQIVKAGELLDIEVLDHIVLGQGRWVSMRERGLGFD
jgi:DNA repair protein RadC